MISGQSASPMSCTAVTSIPQSKWKSAGKDWLPLPSSCHGRKPQKTRSCRQRLGVRRTVFTCPTCSSIFRNGLHIQRCKQIWNSTWARNKFHGQMAAGISNSMGEADETNQPVPPQVASFLYHRERMNVVVEPEVHDTFARLPGFGFVQTFYIQDTRDLHERVDFVACLGGDGVILHASNLFQGAVPPVVSFNLGSLGFLTAHRFADYKLDLRAIIHGNTLTDGVYITLRMRLRCEILRNGEAMPGKVYSVLNEVVVDRGSNPYLCKIECYEHNNLITKVQADGIIVATPTGSTAYSTSAGGSMVHPNVPCMLFTPICPHSLSFRPVILPDSAKLELKIPDDARSNAWVSFDGQRRQQLSKGDSVRICMSEHPLPTVNKCDQTGDWFRSLVRCLNWNERLEQKALIA